MSRHAIDKRTQDLPDPGNDPGGAGLALIPFFTGTETELQSSEGSDPGPPNTDLRFSTPKLCRPWGIQPETDNKLLLQGTENGWGTWVN